MTNIVELISNSSQFLLQAAESANNNVLGANSDTDALITWLNEYKHSKNTFIAYRQCIERFYLWISSLRKDLSQVSREDIQKYKDFLANPQPVDYWCGPKTSKIKDNKLNQDWKPFVKGLTTSSINHQILILKNLFSYLVASEYLHRNPMALERRKPKSKKLATEERILHLDTMALLFKYIEQMPSDTYTKEFDKVQAQWLCKLAYGTGMRISEIADSQMSHFFCRKNNWWLKVIGKGEKPSEIVITQEIMHELAQYRNFHSLPEFPSIEEEIPTIIGRRGNIKKGLSANMLHRIIKKIFSAAADFAADFDSAAAFTLKKASAHWLRHASASAQVEAGISLESVKENLRHESIETTMRYIHKDQEERHQETSRLFTITTKDKLP